LNCLLWEHVQEYTWGRILLESFHIVEIVRKNTQNCY